MYATITRTVAAAVRSPSVALALHRGPQIETVSVTGAEQDAALVLPLVYRGERLGEMRVSPRTPGEPYGRVDRALLDQLANETSALVYALRRDTELQSTRRRALETVAEERARLGRDLHDSIAPAAGRSRADGRGVAQGDDPGYGRRARTPSGSLPACGTPPPRSAGSRTTCNPHQWTIAGSRQRWRTTLPRSTHPRCRRSGSTPRSLDRCRRQWSKGPIWWCSRR